MSRYQDVQAIWVLLLRGVFYIVNPVVIVSTASVVVLDLLAHIYHVIDPQGRLEKRPENGNRALAENGHRALGLIATYAVIMTTFNEFDFPSDQIPSSEVDISIKLVYNMLRYGLLTRQVQKWLTRNRREAEPTGMKWMDSSFGLKMYCQQCLQKLWPGLASFRSTFVILGRNPCLLLLLASVALLVSGSHDPGEIACNFIMLFAHI